MHRSDLNCLKNKHEEKTSDIAICRAKHNSVSTVFAELISDATTTHSEAFILNIIFNKLLINREVLWKSKTDEIDLIQGLAMQSQPVGHANILR